MPVLAQNAEITEETRHGFTEALMPFAGEDAAKRQTAEIQLNRIPVPARVALILETWEKVKAERTKRRQIFMVSMATFFTLLMVLNVLVWTTHLLDSVKVIYFAPLFSLFTTTLSIFLNPFAVAGKQRGIIALLKTTFSPYLVGPILDGLKVTCGEDRETLRYQLKQLLPQYVDLDYAPLNSQQHVILIGELQKLRTSKPLDATRKISEERQEFVLTALQLLFGQTQGRTRTAFRRELARWREIHPIGSVAEELHELMREENRDVHFNILRGKFKTN